MSLDLNNEAVDLMMSGKELGAIFKLQLATCHTPATRQSLVETFSRLSNDHASSDDNSNRLLLVPQSAAASLRYQQDSAETLVEIYDRFISISGAPRIWMKEDHYLVSAVVFYNLGLAIHLQSLNSAAGLVQALRCYQLAASSGNLSQRFETGTAALLSLAILTNMAQIFCCQWEPMQVHFCLKEIHRIASEPWCYASIPTSDIEFFVSNLTYASTLQWKVAPAA